jgi:hypothetical protein
LQQLVLFCLGIAVSRRFAWILAAVVIAEDIVPLSVVCITALINSHHAGINAAAVPCEREVPWDTSIHKLSATTKGHPAVQGNQQPSGARQRKLRYRHA